MPTPLWFDIAIFVFGAVLMFSVFYGVIRLSRHVLGKPSEVAFVGRVKGAEVPVLATFSGFTFLPWGALATNSMNPRLAVYPDHIEFKVLRKQSRPISDIAEVDVKLARRTVNLVFRFHGSSATFTANVGQQALAAQVLAMLPRTANLTASAQDVLATFTPPA
jgi:hypothetical protein